MSSAPAVKTISSVAVVGSGQMGLGIAYVAALRAKVPVLLMDRNKAQIEKGAWLGPYSYALAAFTRAAGYGIIALTGSFLTGLSLFSKLLEKDTAKGKISSEDAKDARDRVSVVEGDLNQLRDVDMVIEVSDEV
jgi:3-hydroxybutyryl-CoA dehydrogenase